MNASYSVVRCVPDPARGETFNVGIVIWDSWNFLVKVDQTAARRAIRANPALARDSLRSLDKMIEERLSRLRPSIGAHKAAQYLIENQTGFPFLLSEPMLVAINEKESQPLDPAMHKLMERLVAAPELLEDSNAAVVEEDPLEHRLRPLVAQGTVIMDYEIRGGQSGLPRSLDFFVNTTVNVGLDRLRLERGSEDSIISKADAEAFKIVDILKSSKVSRLYILCHVKDDPKRYQMNQDAINIVHSAGGTVLKDLPVAAKIIEDAARKLLT